MGKTTTAQVVDEVGRLQTRGTKLNQRNYSFSAWGAPMQALTFLPACFNSSHQRAMVLYTGRGCWVAFQCLHRQRNQRHPRQPGPHRLLQALGPSPRPVRRPRVPVRLRVLLLQPRQ